MRTARSVALVALVAVSACAKPGRLLRGYAEARPDGMASLERGGVWADAPSQVRGQVRFLYDDFGSLNTDGLKRYGTPWKLVAAALVRDRHRTEGEPMTLGTLDRALAEYGFLRPRRILNWQGPQPRLDRPVGIVAGIAHRSFPPVEVEIANLGCAACHSGPVYGADGRPTGDVWLGLPNASLDISAYADDVLRALRRELASPDSLLSTVEVLFPSMSSREETTLRKYIVPRAREQLAERERRFGGLLPFENGGPGLMNGVGSLRFLFGYLHGDARTEQMAWASPPGLEGTTLRRALLVDGVYAAPKSRRFGRMTHDQVDEAHLRQLAGVASLFIVGTQGVLPRTARRHIPSVVEVMHFIDGMRSPRFPGPVDTALALQGARVYGDYCASCHGHYTEGVRDVRLVEHPNRLVAQDRMGTDPVRWQTADSVSLAALGPVGYDHLIEGRNSGGYVAPDLSGVWATAPYLHNGSVPTLWHLLHPEARPERFMVGGHALDYDRMGIAGELDDEGVYVYPKGYVPWSRPSIYDTRQPARSNAGHEFRTLTEDERCALLEYLKVL